MPTAWYVARTTPLGEYRARDYLESVGVECFLPVVATSKPRRGRADTPLFPGYLFVHCDAVSARNTLFYPERGVRGLVTFDGIAPSVPQELVDALKRKVEEINGSGGLWRQYRPGEQVVVRLAGNPYAEVLAGVVAAAVSPRGRVRVLLHFLGRLVQAEVPCELVQPVCVGPARFKRRTRGRGRYIRGVGSRALDTNNGRLP